MAAENNAQSSGRKNYYGVSYGKLSTKVKDIPEGYTEITEADLKSKTQAVEQLDLRSKYVNKGKGDYQYQVFYDSLIGNITAQEKFTNDNGTNLNLTVLDKDGDESIIQIKFYSKYAENILNRLLNTDTAKQMVFFPYAIPNTSEINGENKTYYTSGISLRVDGNKVEPKYKDKRTDSKSLLPDTEQVKAQGKMTTSRDSRLDFLYEEFSKHFKGATETPKAKAPEAKTAQQAFEPADDLPF